LSTQAKDDPVEYIHNEIGYNYRLTNLQAAMGCAQLEQIESYLVQKKQIYKNYKEQLSDVRGLSVMKEAPWARSAFWLSTILINQSQYGMSNRQLLERLQYNQIETRPLWQPLHKSEALQGCWATDCSISESITGAALSIPSSVGLTALDQERVIHTIANLGPHN
ncbi:MAG: DegT/DnrJ/EryC1/StrS family aminotransferase, partial [Chloroflexota bacterium]|nr:DegT/DnrJ/EryC1/StrS family aminotransferase [Chloroflexota bacterium]